jgi:oxaloacetate decarboxylase gamma subunit
MSSSLIEQGLNLMLFGMGTVFVFLTILIFATGAMSKIITLYFPEKAVVVAPKRKKTGALGATSVSPGTLKIIQAAIEQHRNR